MTALRCFNSYPINPAKNKNPLKHLKDDDWNINPGQLLNAGVFYDKYQIIFTYYIMIHHILLKYMKQMEIKNYSINTGESLN